MKALFVLIPVLLVIIISGCTTNQANQVDLPLVEGNVWMKIAPHQCGDIRVPEEMYRGDLENISFPFEFNLTSLFSFALRGPLKEYYDELKSMNVSEEERIDLLMVKEKEIRELFNRTVLLSDAKKGSILDEDGNPIKAFCEACDCPHGYVLYILIPEDYRETFLIIGYNEAT